MSFQAADLLASLFDPGAVAAPVEPQPEAPAAGPAAPSTAEPPAAAVALDSPEAAPLGVWVHRRDCHGRMGLERADVPEESRWWARADFGDLPGPEVSACPTCGSLELSWDILGGRHCQRCQPERLARSVALAAKAAELRRRNPPRPKPVAPDGAGRTPEAPADLKHLSGNRPTAAVSGAVAGLVGSAAGCENGQDNLAVCGE